MTGWWRRRSLRLRLTIVATGVLALGLTVGVLGLSALFARARTADLDTQIQTEASTLHALVSSDQLTQPLPVPPGSPVLAQVVDTAGTVLASTPSAGRVLPIAPAAELATLSGKGPASADETGFGAGQLRLLVEPATLSGTPVHIVAAASVADLQSTLAQLRRVVLVVTPLVVLAAGLAAWYALGAALRPVDEMAAAAQELGAADDPTRPERTLPVPPTDDELARLAVTLNDMLERLRASARQQRDFAADAAHELRTPLTTLLAGLDVARTGGGGTDWDAASADRDPAGTPAHRDHRRPAAAGAHGRRPVGAHGPGRHAWPWRRRRGRTGGRRQRARARAGARPGRTGGGRRRPGGTGADDAQPPRQRRATRPHDGRRVARSRWPPGRAAVCDHGMRCPLSSST